MKLFKKWKTARIANNAAPVSLAASSGVEIAASLFSFGNSQVKESLYLGLQVFPNKFLDWPFIDK